MSRSKVTLQQVLDQGNSISTAELKPLLSRLTKADIMAYAQTRFYGSSFSSSLTKDTLIQAVLDAHESEQDQEIQMPSSTPGRSLEAALANLPFAAPVDPEIMIQMSRRLPPPRILNLDSAPDVVRRAGAIVVDSRNAPQVQLPQTPAQVVSKPREAPTRIGKVRESRVESSEGYQKILEEIDPDRLEQSKGHGKGYSVAQLTAFRKRLNEAPGAPEKIPSTLNKVALIEKLQSLMQI